MPCPVALVWRLHEVERGKDEFLHRLEPGAVREGRHARILPCFGGQHFHDPVRPVDRRPQVYLDNGCCIAITVQVFQPDPLLRGRLAALAFQLDEEQPLARSGGRGRGRESLSRPRRRVCASLSSSWAGRKCATSQPRNVAASITASCRPPRRRGRGSCAGRSFVQPQHGEAGRDHRVPAKYSASIETRKITFNDGGCPRTPSTGFGRREQDHQPADDHLAVRAEHADEHPLHTVILSSGVGSDHEPEQDERQHDHEHESRSSSDVSPQP
jgi:hypothetical protein